MGVCHMVRDLCMFAGFNEDSRIVWFKITYSKGPGSLSAITDFLEKENAYIKFGHIDNITQHIGEYSVFTELKKDVDIEELARKIEGLEAVSMVEHGISEFGMIYSVDFPLNVIGVRGVMARALTIVDIIKILNQSVPHAEGLLTLSGLRGGGHAGNGQAGGSQLQGRAQRIYEYFRRCRGQGKGFSQRRKDQHHCVLLHRLPGRHRGRYQPG